MSRAFAEISFTPSVKAAQSLYGSREANLGFELADDPRHALTEPEMAFIAQRDSFYMASVSETGWPYVQHRGGPAGFIKVLDERTIGFADFKGNRQYISVGNINAEGHVSLILLDYPSRRRLKLWGNAQIVHEADDPKLISSLEDPSYRARIERGIIIRIEAIEWNCPQHITPRFTEREMEVLIAPVLAENQSLKAHQHKPLPAALGNGELPLQISAVRQMTPEIRMYRLEHAQGRFLPLVTPGSHLKVPFLNADNNIDHRNYSICSLDDSQQYYEIAVQLKPDGKGGSKAIHEQYHLGLQINCQQPRNHFQLHSDRRPTVLIAGGIGITPLIPMMRWFSNKNQQVRLHYAGRSLSKMAFAKELLKEFTTRVTFYDASSAERMNVADVLNKAEPGAEFYVCGPQSLMNEVQSAAQHLNIAAERLHTERFAYVSSAEEQALTVTLARSQQIIQVGAHESVLDALLVKGIKLESDCCVGECGQCAVKVTAGTVDHRDQVLSDQDKKAGLMCICVSRALSAAITIDI